MNADELVALLDADAERAGKVGALAGAELIRWDITRRCCEARHAGTWGRSYDLDPSLCKTCAETIDKALALVTESPWLVERLRARDAAIRAVLDLLDRCDREQATYVTTMVGAFEVRAALASALGGGEQQ